MGADNWGICPKCKHNREKEITVKEKKLESSYGSVALGKYQAMQAELETLKATKLIETLREDYEIRTDEDGEFMVSYGCKCNVCGWGHEYTNHFQAFDETKP
jgi:hypothetical protein